MSTQYLSIQRVRDEKVALNESERKREGNHWASTLGHQSEVSIQVT